MELDHVAIGVPDKKEHGPFIFNDFGDRYVMAFELALNCFRVGYLQRDVRESCVFRRFIHQQVGWRGI